MIEKRQLILDCLKRNYGIQASTLMHLAIGADMNASVYKAETPDNRSYFVKLKRGYDHDISVMVLELLQGAGIHEVIPPIQTLQGHSAQRIEDDTLIVYPFVEGQDGFSRSLSDDQWFKLGKALRKIHALNVPPVLQKQLRREDYSPKWRTSLRSLYALLDAEPIGDEVAIQFWKLMKEKIESIRRLVDRAEELGQELQHQTPPFVLCHSDIHAGNVLLRGNDKIYIVDWDDPIMAPKERDLMFIGGGVANVWNQLHEVKSFYKGYGVTDINPKILAYYRHERIVEDIAEYGRELFLKKTGGVQRQEMYKHFEDMFAPRGVVEIAFESDCIL
jgi:spectinomycin phosphotransferase